MRFILGLIIGIVLVPLAILVYLMYGKVPVAVDDPAVPHERQLVHMPLDARMQREMVGTHMEPDAANLTDGARIYVDRCAVCHGLHNHPSALGAHMYPDAPQLLEPHPGNSEVIGVSDDPLGETYWKVLNGIRLTGMPSFKTQLSDPYIWKVSLFLANANKPMPQSALDILNRAPAPPTEAPPHLSDSEAPNQE
ncbi:MAG: cytochrome c [Acidobacteria bacterium]|nr:cytochrome c [Acidobacteriota bacterium]